MYLDSVLYWNDKVKCGELVGGRDTCLMGQGRYVDGPRQFKGGGSNKEILSHLHPIPRNANCGTRGVLLFSDNDFVQSHVY